MICIQINFLAKDFTQEKILKINNINHTNTFLNITTYQNSTIFLILNLLDFHEINNMNMYTQGGTSKNSL